MIVNVDKLNFAYGIDDIFKEANFQIKEKERVGLVGPNGAGKSTFIKLLTGELEADSGNINTASDISVGYLEQELDFDQSKTLNELFNEIFSDYQQKVKRLTQLEEQISNAKEKELNSLLNEYDKLQEFIRLNNVYSYESKIRGMVKGLALSEDDLEKTFSSLSGGEKTRVILAMLLLRSPDFLILDEPTNYLDIESLNWLENTLRNYNGSILLISHDRYFLNRICNRIVEIDDYQFKSYPGDFDHYVEQKEIQQAQQNKLYALTLKEVQRQQSIIRRYRDINSKQSVKHAQSREKALAKIKIPKQIKNQQDILFHFNPKTRSGDDVLKVTELSKGFESKPLFENVNFLIQRKDKIGLIGKNGIGKTTLLNIINRKIKQDSGKLDYGVKVYTAFFDQESNELNEYADFSLIDVIRESNIEMSDGEIRNFLANFQFREEDVFKKVKDLSGGEKVRIKLAQIMLSNANFLIMDEPTNHLDMATKEILENVLINYQGTLLFISHDRYFLNRVANKIFEFTSNGINEYLGNYDDYLDKKALEQANIQTQPEKINKTQQNKLRKKDKQYRQKKVKLENKVKELEKELEETENLIRKLENDMAQPDFYKESDSVEIIKQYQQAKEKSLNLTDDWEEAYLELESFLEEK